MRKKSTSSPAAATSHKHFQSPLKLMDQTQLHLSWSGSGRHFQPPEDIWDLHQWPCTDFTQPLRCWEAVGKSFSPCQMRHMLGYYRQGAGLCSLEAEGIFVGYSKQKCSMKHERCNRRAWESHRYLAKQKQKGLLPRRSRDPTQHSLILGVNRTIALQTSGIPNLLRVGLDPGELALKWLRVISNLKENMILYTVISQAVSWDFRLSSPSHRTGTVWNLDLLDSLAPS